MGDAHQHGPLPDDRDGITHHFVIFAKEGEETIEHNGYLTVDCHPDGCVGQIFLKMNRIGSAENGLATQWAAAVSRMLEMGVPLEELVKEYRGQAFHPSGPTRTPSIRFARSPVDYIARYLERRFIKKLPLELTDAEKGEPDDGSNSPPPFGDFGGEFGK